MATANTQERPVDKRTVQAPEVVALSACRNALVGGFMVFVSLSVSALLQSMEWNGEWRMENRMDGLSFRECFLG